MSAYFYICTHTLVLNLGEPVILSFLCCILQAESQSKPESESPAPLRRGPAAPGPAPVDGNDSWKNTKRTWKIRRLNFSTLSLKHILFQFLEGFQIFHVFLAKNLWAAWPQVPSGRDEWGRGTAPDKKLRTADARAGRKPREKKPRETMRGFGSEKLAWELPINPKVELQDSGEKKVVQSYFINGL